MNLPLRKEKSHDDHGEYLNRPGGDQRWSSLPRQVSSDENGRSRLVQSEISRVDVLSFYAYSARLLLFACSCASSDSASLPFR